MDFRDSLCEDVVGDVDVIALVVVEASIARIVDDVAGYRHIP
jgi:hypothetical protein